MLQLLCLAQMLTLTMSLEVTQPPQPKVPQPMPTLIMPMTQSISLPLSMPMLTYAARLQGLAFAGSHDASAVVLISNLGTEYINISRITVSAPLGTIAQSLYSRGFSCNISPSSRWSVGCDTSSGQAFITPTRPLDSGVGPEAIVLTISGDVTTRVGTASLTVREEVIGGVTSTTALYISKFPAHLPDSLRGLTLDPPLLKQPGPVTVRFDLVTGTSDSSLNAQVCLTVVLLRDGNETKICDGWTRLGFLDTWYQTVHPPTMDSTLWRPSPLFRLRVKYFHRGETRYADISQVLDTAFPE